MANPKQGIKRRRVIQALSTATAAMGLAGCNSQSGSSENSSENLGEKVPTIVIEYWSDSSRTAVVESSMPTVKKNLEDRLGIDVKVKPVQTTTDINNVHNDKRTCHFSYWFHNPSPDRLDPDELTRRYAADWAGADGRPNPPNYASCKHTKPAINQEQANSKQKRQKLVTQAQSVLSKDLAVIPTIRIVGFGAGNTNKVSLAGLGDMGITQLNPKPFAKSDVKKGDSIIVATNTDTTSTKNFPTLTAVFGLAPWNHLVHSPLLEYNENFELKKMLASDYKVKNGGKNITVTLRDATFQNGDPITAEDVQFTFKQLARNAGTYQKASIPEYESIKTTGDKTVEFDFKNPALQFVSKSLSRWGIFHKKTWINNGAKENPTAFSPSTLVGSGPFKLDNLQKGQSMHLTPYSDHPVYSPDHQLTFQSYQSSQSKVQSFVNGEVDFVQNMSPGGTKRIRDNLDSNRFKITQFKGFIPFMLYPEMSYGPQMFTEFRDAVGKVIDRREINAVAMNGESEPILEACPLLDNHPYYPGKDNLRKMTKKKSGDKEAARSVLKSAGWGWDNNGNLHYPSDIDLSPNWPKGEVPTNENYPCLNSKGEYDG